MVRHLVNLGVPPQTCRCHPVPVARRVVGRGDYLVTVGVSSGGCLCVGIER